MKVKEFKKLKKELDAKQIIYLHCHNLIYLTSRQLGEVIELKNRKELK